MSSETIITRRRIAKACDSCRSLKSKCDGKRPQCSRCVGYGYECTWSESRRSARFQKAHSEATGDLPLPSIDLKNTVDAYEELIQELSHKLSETDRASTELKLSQVRRHLPEGLQVSTPSGTASDTDELRASTYPSTGDVSGSSSQRYLGDASDVRFFNAIKQMFHDAPDANGDGLESYEQQEVKHTSHIARSPWLPKRHLADTYVETYFSTIHIAYPFICKPLFYQQYEELWNLGADSEVDGLWLAQLFSLFALGAYYMSFPCHSKTERQPHAEYFQHAQILISQNSTKHTRSHVSAILAQCFYMLAVCQTDRCWVNLGKAVRIGQSIGLHVNPPPAPTATGLAKIRYEMRRRTWYSIYILDRLLALQLGRPPAMHNEDFDVGLPARSDDSAFNLSSDYIPSTPSDTPCISDYFIQMIGFSRHVGDVLQGIYSPIKHQRSREEDIAIAKRLDDDLTQWRLKLPRALRFDLSHTFEKNLIFHRQRNILAVKYHHLRAMIHRPFLWITWSSGDSLAPVVASEKQRQQIITMQQICISEAQKIAHLLYKVPDERSLVQDFPWWQMISCLICASSILLVGSACNAYNDSQDDDASQTLDDDAETCLRVFEALSASSQAASIARDMTRSLKEAKTRIRNRPPMISQAPQTSGDAQQYVAPFTQQRTLFSEQMPGVPPIGNMNYDFADYQNWPSEISDSIVWSSQFVDASMNMLDYNPTTA